MSNQYVEFFRVFGQFGVPFLATYVLLLGLHALLRFQLQERLFLWLNKSCSLCCGSPACLRFWMWALILLPLYLSPIVFFGLWVGFTVSKVTTLIGLSVLFLGGFVCCSIWAMVLWKCNHWKFSNAVLCWWILSLTSVVGQLVLNIFEFPETVEFSFATASASFLTLNMIPHVYLAYSRLPATDFLETMQRLFGSPAEAQALESSRKTRHKRAFWSANIISWMILIGYGLTIQFLASFNTGLGWLVAGSVLFYDIFAGVLQFTRILSSQPLTILSFQVLCRLSLFVFGAQYWFLGFCVAFLTLMLTLGTRIVNLLLPRDQTRIRAQAFRYASNVVLRKDVETGRTTLEAASGSATRSPSPPLVVPNQVQSEESAGGKETPGPEKSAVEDAPGPIKKLGFFKHPVTVNALLLLLGSIPFGVAFVIATATPDVNTPAVPLFDRSHAQWIFGMSSLLLAFGYILGYATMRIFLLQEKWTRVTGTSRAGEAGQNALDMKKEQEKTGARRRQFRWLMIIVALLYWGFLAGFGGLVRSLTGSDVVLTVSIYVAPLSLAFFIFMRLWAFNNFKFYQVDVDKVDRPQRGCLCKLFCCMLCPGDTVQDSALVWFFLLTNLFAIAMGLQMALTVSPAGIGVALLFGLLIAFSVFVPALKYYKRQLFDATFVGFGLWTVILSAVFIALCETELVTSSDVQRDVMRVAWNVICFGFPACALALSALSRWRALEWKADKVVWLNLILAIVLVVAFCVVIAVFSNLLAGIALFCVICIAVYLSIGITIASIREWKFPGWFNISVVVLLSCVAALGIVVAIVSDDGFGGYTISWLSIAALFAFYALFEFLNAQVNRLFYSKRFFPLYRFHVEKSNMTLHNVGGIMLLVAAKMLILWGYAWYHSRAPHSLGVGVACGTILVTLTLIMRGMFAGSIKLQSVAEFLDPDMARKLQRKAAERFLASEEEEEEVSPSEGATPVVQVEAGAIRDQEMALLHSLLPLLKQPQKMQEYQGHFTAFRKAGTREEVVTSGQLVLKTWKEFCGIFAQENIFLIYFRTLLIMSGEFQLRQQHIELAEFVREHGLQEVTAQDIVKWSPAVLEKLKGFLRESRGNKAGREELLQRVKNQTREGRRTKMHVCDSIIPLLDRSDYDIILNRVGHAIEAYRQSGIQFEDADFPPYLVNEKHGNWVRPNFGGGSDACSLFLNGCRAEDLRQGFLGNCWFISAMATVASRDGTIENLFISGERGLEAGIYAVKFFFADHWWGVIMDTRLPQLPNGKPAFCRSTNLKEMWPGLLEKAYAKFWGKEDGYEQLRGGLPYSGTIHLTGGVGRCVMHKPTSETVITGRLWKDLLWWTKRNHYCGSASGGVGDDRVTEQNIVKGHAFSILDVREIEGFQLVKLRNPWADTEWNGDWSDESPLWDRHPKVKKALNPVKSDDGIFWMPFDLYCRNYEVTDHVCDFPEATHEIVQHVFLDPQQPCSFATLTKCPQAWITISGTEPMELGLDIEVARFDCPPDREHSVRASIFPMSQKGRIHKCSVWNTTVEFMKQTRRILWKPDEAGSFVLCIFCRSDMKDFFPIKLRMLLRQEEKSRVEIREAPPDTTPGLEMLEGEQACKPEL